MSNRQFCARCFITQCFIISLLKVRLLFCQEAFDWLSLHFEICRPDFLLSLFLMYPQTSCRALTTFSHLKWRRGILSKRWEVEFYLRRNREACGFYILLLLDISWNPMVSLAPDDRSNLKVELQWGLHSLIKLYGGFFLLHLVRQRQTHDDSVDPWVAAFRAFSQPTAAASATLVSSFLVSAPLQLCF